MNLVLAKSELIPDQFSHLDVLLPSIHNVGEPLFGGLPNSPSNDVLLKQTSCFPIDLCHHCCYLILVIAFFSHEVLQVFYFTLVLPVLGTSGTAEVLII